MSESARTSTSTRHTPSGRWKLGLLLSVTTVLLWSHAPIVLTFLLGHMNVITITWYRFAAVAVLLWMILRSRGPLPPTRVFASGKAGVLILVAGAGLAGNFVLFIYALNFIPPGASQIAMQIAPLFVLMGGVTIYREAFSKVQGGGICLVLVGLMLFFHHRLQELNEPGSKYVFGIFVVITAALSWAVFALAQKQLLRASSSTHVTLIIYIVGAIIMVPFCSFTQIAGLGVPQYLALGYSIFNMLVGYGCFAEALEHWEASRVSAVICTTPILTLTFSYLASAIWPGQLIPDQLSIIGILGALLVVAGSMTTALGRRKLSSEAGYRMGPDEE